ncbi:MAG: hypothetical protein IJA89_01170 [Clostridia bacterium]|nr:hypothetical protein [Clostridia bacterium]
MKKITAVLALSMALTFAFAGCSDSKGTGTGGNAKENQLHNSFIDEIGGVSETYKGAISSNSYNSAEEAAEAFVSEEVAGDSNVNIVSTTVQQGYKGSEIQTVIAQQKLPIEDTSDIQSIAKMEVTYSVDSGDTYASPMAMASNSNKKVTVYVIKYSTHWEYYSPAPTTGSTITKSYYDSVFNSDAWKNCTYDMDMNMNMDVKASGQGVSMTMKMTMTMNQFAQYSEDKVYIEQEYSYTMSGMGENETESEYIALYMEKVDDQTVCYVKQDKNASWELAYSYNFDSIDEFRPFADGYLDYTYFTKTDYGFELSGDNAMQFLRETAGGELDSFLSQGMNIDMFCKYYVANGVLSGMREDATMSMNMSESGVSGSVKAVIGAEASVKNYGSTVVQKPADIVD